MADSRTTQWLRLAPLAAIALGIAAFFGLGLNRYISLDALRAYRAALDSFVAAHLVLALLAFAALFILGVTFSLPVSLVLSLAGGYLFGVPLGEPVIVVSVTIGATLFFLAARTSLGQLLRARAGSALDNLEQGFRADAFNYLLVLRLLPLPPVFIANLAAALIGMKVRDFFFATLIGVIPTTLVYAAVGHGLRAAFDAGASVDPGAAVWRLIISPQVLLPMAGLIVLALVPVALKRLKLVRGA